MARAESYVEEVVIIKSGGEGHISSDIDETLRKLGYTWLSGWGAREDGFTSERVRSLNPPAHYPRFHLKVWNVKREGEYLFVTIQVHLDVAKHESPMDEASRLQCVEELERLISEVNSVPS